MIVESVRSLLALRYPHHEVIVVNDGSSDGTIARAADAFDLVLCGGAARAIPTAPVRATYVSRRHRNLSSSTRRTRLARTPSTPGSTPRGSRRLRLDADSLLEHDALLRSRSRSSTTPSLLVAAGGTSGSPTAARSTRSGRRRGLPRAASRRCRCSSTSARSSSRARLEPAECARIISGGLRALPPPVARGRRRVLDGESARTSSSRSASTAPARARRAYRIAFISDPVCWTGAGGSSPPSADSADAGSAASGRASAATPALIGRPRYGVVGDRRRCRIRLLRVPQPRPRSPRTRSHDGLVPPRRAVPGVFPRVPHVSIGLGLLLTTAALALEEFSYRRYRRRGEVVRLLVYAVVENVGYRQLHDAWRAMGYVDIVRGKKGWGAQQRRGFAAPADSGTTDR